VTELPGSDPVVALTPVPPDGGAGPVSSSKFLGSAALLAAGNIVSRLLGLLRESAIAALYGGGGDGVTSALRVAASVPVLINDLLINGQLSAAVVPVLSAYRAERRNEFWEAASVLLTAATVVTSAGAVLVYFGAGAIAQLLNAAELGPTGVVLVTESLRILAPSVMLLGLVGMVTGVLFAREHFGLPALAMATFNAAFLAVLLAGYGRFGPYAMPLAMTASALVQLLVLLPGLRGGQLRPVLNLNHPALRRVVWLYLPILAGLLFEQGKNVIDIRLANEASKAAYANMQFATRLVQFPHGLVSVALSLAILPSLSASFASGARTVYAETLAKGLRLVVALALPAALGLMALAQPVVAVVYEHGKFGPEYRFLVALALVVYLIGLPFASIDWPLNFAYYARQNTWVPALVGVLSVVAFLVVAVLFGPVLNLAQLSPPLVFLGLVLADSVKHIVHATVMAVLVRRAAGPEALAGLWRTVAGAGAAAVIMAVAVAVVDQRIAAAVPDTMTGWLLRLTVGLALGVMLYIPLATRLGVAEIPWIAGVLRTRLRPG
jgi:putative peptidoglycan lipid II flippase